jgi:hypothetical protein
VLEKKMYQKNMPRRTSGSLIASGTVALMVSLALLSGCGGSSDGNRLGGSLGGDSGTEQAIGLLTTRVVGTAQPPVISDIGSGTAVTRVTGVAGASFTHLAQNRATSRFAYAEGGQIWTMSATGNGSPTQITTDGTSKEFPIWSPDGTRIAYVGNGNLFVIPATGGTPTQITNGYPMERASWSRDGSKFAFISNKQIFTVPSNEGTPPTQITHDQQHWEDVFWSSDSSKLVGATWEPDDTQKLFTLPSDGSGTPTLLASDQYIIFPSLSPDGSKIAYEGMYGAVRVVPVSGGEAKSIYNTNIAGVLRVSWSPDSTHIAIPVGSSNPPPSINLVSVPVEGGEPTVIGPDINGRSHFAWSPFQTDTETAPLLGGNGPLGNDTAAGFLFVQNSNHVLSVLAFDTAIDTADSRSEARIAEVSTGNTNDPFRLFTISAPDGLGKVAYVSLDSATGTPGPVVAPVLPQSSLSAVVLFDIATGKITAVLPYTPDASRSVRNDAPQVVRQGNTVVLKGHFPAVFDATGKNRAPAGATEIRLDTRTGELLSIP